LAGEAECGRDTARWFVSLVGEQTLLRAYLQSADRAPHTPTHERMIQAARKEKLAGATVLRGIIGAGYHETIKHSVFSLARHVPIIVEIVDSAEKIAAFINGPLDQIMIDGMITLERAAVMMYRQRSHDQPNSLHLAGALKPLSTTPKIEPRGETGKTMRINENGILLRVFIGDSDKWEHKRLYEAIVLKGRELGLAGATVLRGTEGFGANSVVHTSDLLAMSTDLPVVIEIVDSEEKIKLLLPHLETMVQEGMITMEHVMILMYRHNNASAAPVSPDAASQT
jgi:PII-like signaling protein